MSQNNLLSIASLRQRQRSSKAVGWDNGVMRQTGNVAGSTIVIECHEGRYGARQW